MEPMTDVWRQNAAIFTCGDTENVREFFGQDSIDRQQAPQSELSGPEEFVAVVQRARRRLPDLQVSVVGDTLNGEDLSIGVLRWTSDDLGLQRDTVEVLRMEQGVAVEHWGVEVRSHQGGGGWHGPLSGMAPAVTGDDPRSKASTTPDVAVI
jgi:predicted SnoaL-like aldol condensation-catalyzing enzyme